MLRWFGLFSFTCGDNSGRICAKLPAKISQCQSLLHLFIFFKLSIPSFTWPQTAAMALTPSLSRQMRVVGRKIIPRSRSKGGRRQRWKKYQDGSTQDSPFQFKLHQELFSCTTQQYYGQCKYISLFHSTPSQCRIVTTS